MNALTDHNTHTQTQQALTCADDVHVGAWAMGHLWKIGLRQKSVYFYLMNVNNALCRKPRYEWRPLLGGLNGAVKFVGHYSGN